MKGIQPNRLQLLKDSRHLQSEKGNKTFNFREQNDSTCQKGRTQLSPPAVAWGSKASDLLSKHHIGPAGFTREMNELFNVKCVHVKVLY